MVVKLNPRSTIELSIGGNDFSEEFVAAQGSYSSLSLPSSGLCLMSGSVTISQNSNTNRDYDSRFNPLWRRGTVITLKDTGDFLPVVGKSFIITADYDMMSTLVLNIGCLLSLYNFRTANNSVVCTNFGTNTGVGDILISLIEAAGIDISDIQLTELLELNKYYRSEPLLVGSTQSLLQAAGVIAGQHGGFLVQTSTGKIKFQSMVENLEYLHYSKAEDLQSYQRDGQPETFVSQYTFRYNRTEVLSELNVSTNSVRSGDTLVEVSSSRDLDSRTTSSTIKEYRETSVGNYSLISTSTTNSTFEQPSSASLGQVRDASVVDLETCFPDANSKILLKEIITTSNNTEVLKAWLATKATASIPSGFSVSGVITATKTTESYSYQDNQILKITDVFQPAGYAIPLLGDLSLGRSGGPTPITDIDPTSLIISDRIIESWSKSYVLGQRWNYFKNTFRNRYLVKPEDLTQQVLDATINLQSISLQAQQLIPINREVEFNVEEPVFETFQLNTEIGREPRRFVIGQPTGNGFETSQVVDLGDYGNPDEDYLKKYGSAIFDFDNGRILGMSVALSLYSIKNNWVNVLPAATSKIREPAVIRQGIASIFKIDSPTVVISQTEALLSYTGSFVGFSNDSLNTSYYGDIIQSPPTLPSSAPVTVVEFEDIEYNSSKTFTFVYTP